MDKHDKHRLKLNSKIGSGAFGKVFKGKYDGSPVAVKTIASDDGPQAQHHAFKMFAREAQVLQECSHGRIIGFLALCRLNTDTHDGKKHSSGGKWALVLEYAKGGTLQDKVSASMISAGGKVYSNAQALSWALDVASALEYLHAKRPAVLHRDVKLSNVLLAAEEGQMVAKLSDFGLHVVADDQRDRLLRVSVSSANGTSSHYHTAPHTRRASEPSGTLASTAEAALPGGKAAAKAGDEVDSTCVTGMACDGPTNTRAAGSSGPSSANSSAHGDWRSNSRLQLTQQHVQTLQQQLAQGSAPVAAAAAAGRSAGAPSPGPGCDIMQQVRQGAPGGTFDHHYGEMHDSSGSVGFVGALPTFPALLGAADIAAAAGGGGGGGRRRPGPGRSASFNNGSSAGGGAGQQGRGGPKRSVSFRNESASHPGDADYTPLAAGSGPDDSAAAYPPGYSAWGLPGTVSRDDSSMCSIVTDGTWITDDTDGTEMGYDGTDDGGCTTQAETVFNMTGKTGSFMYMSPEVFLAQPYNEKADVFSFGVVLYELLARVLLLFTELPSTSDPSVTEQYATKVAGGYRPAKPKRMPDGVWCIIEACWQQEPCNRPSMSQVVTQLQQLLRDGEAGPSSRRSSFSTGKASSTKDEPISGGHPAATTVATTTGDAGGDAAVGASGPDSAPPAPGCACVIC